MNDWIKQNTYITCGLGGAVALLSGVDAGSNDTPQEKRVGMTASRICSTWQYLDRKAKPPLHQHRNV
ncbi:MAG: hypothetical protein H8D49_05635 [Dehalococcoidia bacterium]|nr:hypothetical protein [Dehalococcoidia bacterium]MBL7164985.1 hypothetical protein [Dehalococcoidales bacterium]